MKGKIAVVGLGQGGVVAALGLKRQGYDVAVYEAKSRAEMGYDWYDDISSNIFELTDVPMPPREVYRAKSKWLFVSPDGEHSLPVPPMPEMTEISIYRRGLSEHFVKLLEAAGCELNFGIQVHNLALKNGKVTGLVLDGKEYPFDLVIDASGMNSALRAQLPQRYGVQAEVNKDGVLNGYRAFFEAKEGAKPPVEGINSTMVIKHLGEKGISWCNLTPDGKVDVLIGRIGALSVEDITAAIYDLRTKFEILGDKIISEQHVQICLRNGIALGFADGYIAIGDSAFMTMPLMGSGIESSMAAGKLLSDMVKSGEVADFGAEQLWNFWRRYMREKGGDFALINVIKSWALSQKPERIDWVFSSGLIGSDDLAALSTDQSDNSSKKCNDGVKNSAKRGGNKDNSGNGFSFKSILKKIALLMTKPKFVCSAIQALIRALMAKSCAVHAPEKYSEGAVSRWAKKYDRRAEKYEK